MVLRSRRPCFLKMSVFSFSRSCAQFRGEEGCARTEKGCVCNAFVFRFCVPHPPSPLPPSPIDLRVSASHLQVLLLFLWILCCLVGALLGATWNPKPATTQMKCTLFLLVGGCNFEDLLGLLMLSPAILHQDSVSQIYGNRCFPSQRLVVRKFVLRICDFA